MEFQSVLDRALTQQATQQTDVQKFQKQTEKEVKIKTQDWEKRIQEKRSEYQVLIAEINAQAALYAAETRAKGDAERDIAVARGNLAIEKAEALRDELRNEALDTQGGRIKLALDAALDPADEPYLFFVARPDGHHVFTRTLAEHNRAKAAARREFDRAAKDRTGL